MIEQYPSIPSDHTPSLYLPPSSSVCSDCRDGSSVALKVDHYSRFRAVPLALIDNTLFTAHQELVDITRGKGHAGNSNRTSLTILQLQKLLYARIDCLMMTHYAN